jgi:uncharacterized membrane protein
MPLPLFHFLVLVHVAAAALALAVLWLPMVANKGGRTHRRAGRVYVWAMGIVVATSFPLNAHRLLTGDAGQRRRALFLLYVGLLGATSLWMGLRALADKQRAGAHRDARDLGLPVALVAAGVAVLVYGLRLGAPLLYGFAPVGILVGAGQLHYWLRPPRERMHWWLQHMGGMIASGIVSLTAFLVSNAPRLHLPRWSIWVWLSPTLVGVPCLWLWQRYYRHRFAADQASTAASA